MKSQLVPVKGQQVHVSGSNLNGSKKKILQHLFPCNVAVTLRFNVNMGTEGICCGQTGV